MQIGTMRHTRLAGKRHKNDGMRGNVLAPSPARTEGAMSVQVAQNLLIRELLSKDGADGCASQLTWIATH